MPFVFRTGSLKLSPDRYLKKGEGYSSSIFSLPKISKLMERIKKGNSMKWFIAHAHTKS